MLKPNTDYLNRLRTSVGVAIINAFLYGRLSDDRIERRKFGDIGRHENLVAAAIPQEYSVGGCVVYHKAGGDNAVPNAAFATTTATRTRTRIWIWIRRIAGRGW